MTKIRLVADDLTGALDAAAQFVGGGQEIPVYLSYQLPTPHPEAYGVDLATREKDGPSAASIAARSAQLLAPAPDLISFKKVDSLLRGNPGVELAAIMGEIPGASWVIAPAFPFQRRITRGGRQFFMQDGGWQRTGEDLKATLESHGIAVRSLRPGDSAPSGVSLWDAETDHDLEMIARSGAGRPEPLVWCGSGGLAAALSRSPSPAPPAARVGRPLLGLFGSAHPVTLAQLRACGDRVLAIRDFGAANAALVTAALAEAGVCHVCFDLPDGTGRTQACARIAQAMAEAAVHLGPPGQLLVVGGETLRALCTALGTTRLDVIGQLVPGVPMSRMVGGRWDGTELISKSGAFGDPALLRQIAAHGGR